MGICMTPKAHPFLVYSLPPTLPCMYQNKTFNRLMRRKMLKIWNCVEECTIGLIRTLKVLFLAPILSCKPGCWSFAHDKLRASRMSLENSRGVVPRLLGYQ